MVQSGSEPRDDDVYDVIQTRKYNGLISMGKSIESLFDIQPKVDIYNVFK